MTFWNYRVIKTNEDGFDSYALYEVFYDDDGTPWGRTQDPIAFAAGELDDLVNALNMAVRDVQNKDVLTDDDFKDDFDE